MIGHIIENFSNYFKTVCFVFWRLHFANVSKRMFNTIASIKTKEGL